MQRLTPVIGLLGRPSGLPSPTPGTHRFRQQRPAGCGYAWPLLRRRRPADAGTNPRFGLGEIPGTDRQLSRRRPGQAGASAGALRSPPLTALRADADHRVLTPVATADTRRVVL